MTARRVPKVLMQIGNQFLYDQGVNRGCGVIIKIDWFHKHLSAATIIVLKSNLTISRLMNREMTGMHA
jgi:hypothetical protein